MLEEIINIMLSLLNSFVLIYIGKEISCIKRKISIKRYALYIVLLGTILYVASIYTNMLFKIIFLSLGFVISMKYLLGISYTKATIISIVSILILAISDMIGGGLVTIIFGSYLTEIRYNLLFKIAINIVVFSISILLSKFKFIKNKLISNYDFINKQRIVVILYGIITVIIFAINNYILEIVSTKNIEKVSLYGGIIFVAYFIITGIFIFLNYSLVKQKDKYFKKQLEYEKLKTYTSIIENLVEDMQKFKHDFSNTMISIKGYIDEGDNEGLKKYFYDELLKEKKSIDKKNIYFIKHIKNPGIKGLLTTKLERCFNLDLDVKLEIFEDIKDIKIETYYICRILGILLDNAIEAAEKSIEKKIRIGIENEEKGISIIIMNTFDEKPDINNIYNKGYSTKNENRGLGLAIVKEICKKTKGNIVLNTTIENNTFIQDLFIKDL